MKTKPFTPKQLADMAEVETNKPFSWARKPIQIIAEILGLK